MAEKDFMDKNWDSVPVCIGSWLPFCIAHNIVITLPSIEIAIDVVIFQSYR